MTSPTSSRLWTPSSTVRGGHSSPDELPPEVPWDQLGPEFFEAWGRPRGAVDAEHISIYGKSGSGKTYFLTYILTERARLRGTHAVVVATKKADATLTDAGWPIIDDWPPDYDQHQVIWWARGGLSAEQQAEQQHKMRVIMHTLWKQDANKIVAWDELTYVCNDLGLAVPIGTYYREGRGLGITNAAVMQRPAGVTRYVHSEVGWTVSFAIKDEDDRNRVAEVFGDRRYYREVIKRLKQEQHQFVLKRELTGECFVSSLPSTRPVLPPAKEQPGNGPNDRGNYMS